jgi:transcription elongation factor GreA-like protein
LKKVKNVLATTLKAEAQLWLAEGQKAKAKAKDKHVFCQNGSTLLPLVYDPASISWNFSQNVRFQHVVCSLSDLTAEAQQWLRCVPAMFGRVNPPE